MVFSPRYSIKDIEGWGIFFRRDIKPLWWKRGDARIKDETIAAAYSNYGYTLKEIAEHLGVHYATISRAIKRAEQRNN
jgi:hypothetical protein